MKFPIILIVCILIAILAAGAAGDIIPNAVDGEKKVTVPARMRDLQEGLPDRSYYPINPPGGDDSETRLVLLGTTGGVTWYPAVDRASSSSALVVGDTIYIIDLGQGSTSRLSQAFNTQESDSGTSTFLENARALFFTHLHQDHIADYPSLLLIGPGTGLGTKTDPLTGNVTIVPFIVVGPADRGALEIDKSYYRARNGTIIYTDSANPSLVTPTPGTRQMTNLIWQAYAQTINDMTLDNAYRDFTKLVEIREIGGTYPGDIYFPAPDVDLGNGTTCAAMDPFEVYRDENVVVTATLVDHHQVYPAFAYRFDTREGSVVFSGDTGPDTRGNLEKLADGADILVHEVIDRAWIDERMGDPDQNTPAFALKTHLLTAHTPIDAVGSVASNCSVDTLVLNHIVPGNTPISHLLQAKDNFTGRLIIGQDMMEIPV